MHLVGNFASHLRGIVGHECGHLGPGARGKDINSEINCIDFCLMCAETSAQFEAQLDILKHELHFACVIKTAFYRSNNKIYDVTAD